MNKYLNLSALKVAFTLFIVTVTGFEALSQTPKKPDDNRFTKVVLAQRIEEPMQFQIMKDGKVLYAERKGKVKVYDPATGKISIVGEVAVSTKYVSSTGEVSEGEDGLQGVILDPDYDKNHFLYIYYAPAGDKAENILVRYEWLGKEWVSSSRKVILEVITQREECCHVGGGMLFDKDKNLFLTTGDNTFSRASDGFTPLDERPGKSPEDSQKSSGNTNDLRGKILRIHPQPDGSYTIPEGNLFPKGTPLTRPEIYTMGNRNPWRPNIDSKTGYLYWGEVGPDGSRDDFEKRGPQSYDEFNVAKKPGNYGWPYFIGDSKPYHDYNFETKETGPLFDPAHPINDSPNNTGMKELPPTTLPMVWYGKGVSKEFPLMGSGGNSAVGGPIYHRADFTNPKRPFPEYYEGKWFITDWVRGWINVIEFNETGDYKAMESFLPDMKLKGPIDIKFGPEGDLYVLEYGNGYFKDNPEAQLIRIEYNGGNRKPQVQASADKTAGAVPLKVSLSSAGTKDFDQGDQITYDWKITKNGVAFKTSKEANPSISITTPGVYKALLTVTDQKGAKNSKSIEIKAGNEPPAVKFAITSGNKSFFFPGKTIGYTVNVLDKEDGSLANKRIPASQVSVTANYLSEGYNMTAIAQKQQSGDASAQYSTAISLINKSDCKSCHSVNEKVLGPAFVQVAQKYKGDPAAQANLVKKILNGGSGVWGDAMMPAHNTMADADVRSIAKYILSLAYPPRKAKSLPVQGTYVTTVPEGENTDGSFLLRAQYTDRGTKTAAAQSTEDVYILHSPVVPIGKANEAKDVVFNGDSTIATVATAGAFLKFSKVDLKGIKQIDLVTFAPRMAPGSKPAEVKDMVEVHAGSPDGKVIGKFSGDTALQKAALEEQAGVEDLYFVFKSTVPVRIREIKFNE